MCGIFGLVAGPTSPLSRRRALQAHLSRLFLLSESRGKEAAGLALATEDELRVYRAPIPAHELIAGQPYKDMLRDAIGTRRLAIVAHSRLVTDGLRWVNRNNQPVVGDGVVGVHNGIVVNYRELWSQNPDLVQRSELDSELIFALMRKFGGEEFDLVEATRRTYSAIKGTASIAALFDERDVLLLATNNGSLYYRLTSDRSSFVFASEAYILERLGRMRGRLFADSPTRQLRAGEGCLLNLESLVATPFTLQGSETPSVPAAAGRRVIDLSPTTDRRGRTVKSSDVSVDELRERFPYRSMFDRLRRCERCILPETMPFIDFDEHGVCSYCRNFVPVSVRGHDELERLVAPFRKGGGAADCVVGVSGGRDSIYGLHYVKKVLGLNPVAYTYDWGMVTDLARRNTSRICGKLGIEHILVSADIPRKRSFIRKNVEAWLARPSLGTIPLFMAGDKAYFHHLAQVRKQTGISLGILCENLLERTDFKTGFAGVAPAFDEDHVYTLPARAKLKLAAYYGAQIARNPRLLNSSLVDSVSAFAYYYLIDRDYHNLYRYVPWTEEVVESTLFGEYDFELAEDTQSTWRIGDGTAAFYNYVYYAVTGMTENDTFRSNQIRNGAIGREEALRRVDRENRPRFQSMLWYLETIGTRYSIEEVLNIVERIPKLYQ